MNYLLISDVDLERHPSLERWMWPQAPAVRSPACLYYVPEDHPNIALIACTVTGPWRELPIESNRETRTLI